MVDPRSAATAAAPDFKSPLERLGLRHKCGRWGCVCAHLMDHLMALWLMVLHGVYYFGKLGFRPEISASLVRSVAVTETRGCR